MKGACRRKFLCFGREFQEIFADAIGHFFEICLYICFGFKFCLRFQAMFELWKMPAMRFFITWNFPSYFSYIYTGEVVPSIESVGSALYLANKYFVTGLCKDCIEFLKDSLDAANVCDFFEIAELFEELKEM